MATVSMAKFAEQTKLLAESVGETFYQVSVETTYSNGGLFQIQFRCYINPSRSTVASTPKECIKKMKEVLNPIPNKIKNVTVNI